MSYLERLQGKYQSDDTVARLLPPRGSPLWSVSSDDTVAASVSMLCEHNVGALPVIDEDQLVGIISERDCVRRVMAKKRSPAKLKVSQIMSRDVVVGWPAQQIEDALELMDEHRIRHLPIVEKNAVVGMVSLRRLAAAELERRQALLDRLDEFVLG